MRTRTVRLASAFLAAAGLLTGMAPADDGARGDERAVFQYRVAVKTEKAPSTALVWIPADAPQIRGVILAGATLMEREFVAHPSIRAACERQSLAVVFLNTGLQSTDIQDVLNDVARSSGHEEIGAAPLLFVGHSAGGPQAQAMAVKFADRCFGLIQYAGGGPFNGEPLPATVPSIMVIGQYDEYGGVMRSSEGREQWRRATDALADYRSKDANRAACAVVEPGAGHFGFSDRQANLLALFIEKAARARIDPAEGSALRTIDVKTGWLGDLDVKSPKSPAAPAERYAGDAARSNWFFDEAFAKAVDAFHVGLDRKDQFIRWTDKYWVDAGTRYFFTELKWVGDGQTFQVHPEYLKAYPQPEKNGGPRWLQAGQPVGQSNAPIRVRRATGPIVPVGNTTFRIRFDALNPATEPIRTTFLAFSEGDAEYRYTEHVGMMPRGYKGLDKGKAQAITFPELNDVSANVGPIRLAATSDSGLPVEYHIAYGPARVDHNGILTLDELPKRAAYPIEVSVVAYQFGSGVEPLVKTAAPVTQTFRIAQP